MRNYIIPKDYRPYTDKYFLRAKEILEKENLNPTVTYQLFIRKGNCKVYGINEAIDIIKTFTKNTVVYSLNEGDYISPCETIMTITAPVQEIIALETIILGVISANTTIKNGDNPIRIDDIETNMGIIVDLIKPRPIYYFGARHWHWNMDYDISRTCFDAGVKGCSTDIGAYSNGQVGMGTIPHALEAIYEWEWGIECAVIGSTEMFDKNMDRTIPRIALIDYANREITDSVKTAKALKSNKSKLDGIRIDTCGENYMEGVIPTTTGMAHVINEGVCIFGVYQVRQVLNNNGFGDVKIILSSGFGDPNKVKAFLRAERQYGKLFDGLGVGGVFKSRMATMDIINIEGEEIHKVGRNPRPNNRLMRRI